MKSALTRSQRSATGPGRYHGPALLAALVVAGAALTGGSVPIAAAQAANHCISIGGLDLNVACGVSEAIVAPRCSVINAGQHYRVWAGWWMDDTFEAVPQGFVAAGDTPLEDFQARFVAVKYVVDPGTARERTYVFENKGNLWTGSLFGFPHVNTLTLASLKPLPVGPHRIDMYWIFSAMHCDGATTSIADGCFQAGETRYGAPGKPAFDVAPPHR